MKSLSSGRIRNPRSAIRNSRTLLILFLLAALLRAAPTAIPTFECISLYFPSPAATVCQVQYRTAGTGEWLPARFGRRAYENVWAPWELYANSAEQPAGK